MLLACFNNAYKIDSRVLRAWAAILARVPDAHLLLTVGDEAQPLLRQHWQAAGGDPNRLLFGPRIAPADHLRRAAACDLFLDCFRYHAGATGVSAARAGLPVLCRAGEQPVARMGASLACVLGMRELVVGSVHAYVESAVALAGDPAHLHALRQRLRTALQGGAGNAAAFARRLESAYLEAWRRHCSGALPASFDVAP
jgi:predicted O-linked N-acetylglucosamine transferase (SPINDLY family)